MEPLDPHMKERFLRVWNSKINASVEDVAEMIGFSRVRCIMLAVHYRKQKEFVTVRKDATFTDEELAEIWNDKEKYFSVPDVCEATGIDQKWLCTRINNIRATGKHVVASRL